MPWEIVGGGGGGGGHYPLPRTPWIGVGPVKCFTTRSEILTICRRTSARRGTHYGPGLVLLPYESTNIRAKRHYDLARKFALIIQAHAPARI